MSGCAAGCDELGQSEEGESEWVIWSILIAACRLDQLAILFSSLHLLILALRCEETQTEAETVKHKMRRHQTNDRTSRRKSRQGQEKSQSEENRQSIQTTVMS